MNTLTQQDARLRVGVMVQQSADTADKTQLIIDEDANRVDYITEENEKMSFVFDAVASQNSIQRLYSELLQPLGALVCSGFHAAVLVGGTFKSGKEKLLHAHGIVKQMVTSLFNEMRKTEEERLITVSAIQFYPDDSAVDLLNPERQVLKPRNHCALGRLVEGVSEIAISSPEEALSLYEEGREALKTNSGKLISRCSFMFSVNLEHRLQEQDAGYQVYSRSRLQLFDLAGGARKGDLNGVSTLVNVVEHIESQNMADNRLLPFLLMNTLIGSSNILLYCIHPQALLDEETSHALVLGQRLRSVVTQLVPGQWCPHKAAQDIRERICELRTRMMSQVETREEDIRALEQLIEDLEVMKEQDWEKKRTQSDEILEKKKMLNRQRSQLETPSCSADLQGVTEKLKLLHTQLRMETEAHLREGKVSVEKSQERLGRIQKLREALKEEEAKLTADSRGSDESGIQTNQTEDGFSEISEVEAEYAKALSRRQLLTEEHNTMIQEETKKMEKELKAEKREGLEGQLLWMSKERQILVLQLEALRREKLEAERDLEAQHSRHAQELRSIREESLQVFRVYRQVFEEQKEISEDRYRSLLQEAIQDAVFLSTKNQHLQAENKQLRRALAELKDIISARPDPTGCRGGGCHGNDCRPPARREEESNRKGTC